MGKSSSKKPRQRSRSTEPAAEKIKEVRCERCRRTIDSMENAHIDGMIDSLSDAVAALFVRVDALKDTVLRSEFFNLDLVDRHGDHAW